MGAAEGLGGAGGGADGGRWRTTGLLRLLGRVGACGAPPSAARVRLGISEPVGSPAQGQDPPSVRREALRAVRVVNMHTLSGSSAGPSARAPPCYAPRGGRQRVSGRVAAAPVLSRHVQVEIWSDVACPWCYVGTARGSSGPSPRPASRSTSCTGPSSSTRTCPPGRARRSPSTWHGSSVTAAGCRPPTPGSPTPASSSASTSAGRRCAGPTPSTPIGCWRGRSTRSGPDAQRTLKKALLRAYFTDGREVADHEVLADLAAEAGLDRAAAEALLASDDEADFVRAEREEAYGNGINAVPTFVVEGAVDAPGRPRHRQVGQGPHPPRVGARLTRPGALSIGIRSPGERERRAGGGRGWRP